MLQLKIACELEGNVGLEPVHVGEAIKTHVYSKQAAIELSEIAVILK